MEIGQKLESYNHSFLTNQYDHLHYLRPRSGVCLFANDVRKSTKWAFIYVNPPRKEMLSNRFSLMWMCVFAVSLLIFFDMLSEFTFANMEAVARHQKRNFSLVNGKSVDQQDRNGKKKKKRWRY